MKITAHNFSTYTFSFNDVTSIQIENDTNNYKIKSIDDVEAYPELRCLTVTDEQGCEWDLYFDGEHFVVELAGEFVVVEGSVTLIF